MGTGINSSQWDMCISTGMSILPHPCFFLLGWNVEVETLMWRLSLSSLFRSQGVMCVKNHRQCYQRNLKTWWLRNFYIRLSLVWIMWDIIVSCLRHYYFEFTITQEWTLFYWYNYKISCVRSRSWIFNSC